MVKEECECPECGADIVIRGEFGLREIFDERTLMELEIMSESLVDAGQTLQTQTGLTVGAGHDLEAAGHSLEKVVTDDED